MLKASAAPEAVAPRAAMSRALRTSPKRREAMVPAIITTEERMIDAGLGGFRLGRGSGAGRGAWARWLG